MRSNIRHCWVIVDTNNCCSLATRHNTGRLSGHSHMHASCVRDKYKTERLWAEAADGVQVPISLVYRTDLVHKDGSDPFLLDAYGAYGVFFSL